jgi:outer membrane lipoprotein-sorting protein
VGWADSWEGIKKAAEQVRSIRADFVQEKHMKILKKPLFSKGILYYRIPGSLRWEYESPVKSILLMHNGQTKRYIQSKDGLVRDKGAGLQAMQFVLPEITRWFGGQFDENPDFEATLESGSRIVLRPKKQAIAKMITHIELSLADRPGVIKSVTIYESKETFTKIKFENPRLNNTLQDAIFQEI